MDKILQEDKSDAAIEAAETDIFQIIDRSAHHVINTPPIMIRQIDADDIKSRRLEICFNKLMFEIVITGSNYNVISMTTTVNARIRLQFRPDCRFIDAFSSYDCEFTFSNEEPKLTRIIRSDRKQDPMLRLKSVLVDHSIVEIQPEIIVRRLIPRFTHSIMKEFINNWAQSLRHEFTSSQAVEQIST